MRDFKQFPTVHCHPASLDSASTPAAFAKRELEIGSGAITCTDHGTLQAAQQIYELGKAKKLIPIVGLEAYFRDDDCPILKAHDIPRTDTVPKGSDRDEWLRRNPQGTFIDYWKYAHVTMHFMDEAAYLCAVRLLSKADLRAEQHGSERKPLFAWSDLEELAAQNVTATSSCLIGIVQRHLMSQNNPTIGKAYFDRMKHLFGDRFYVEVFPHTCTHDYVEAVFIDVGTPEEKETLRFKWEKKLKTDAGEFYAQDIAENFNPEKHGKLLAHSHYRKWYDFDNPRQILAVRKEKGFIKNECRPWAPDSDVQRGCNKFVLSLAKANKVPVVIGDDSHFVTEDEKIIQDIRLAQQGPWRFHGSYHRQTSREAFLHFEQTLGLSEDTFEGWVDNAIGWSQRFTDFKFNTEPSLPTKFYPEATLAHTKTLIEKHGRMRKTDPRALKRLRAEIDLVHRNGIDLLPYFMIDEEVCSFFESKGLLTGPGRGSAAGLSLAYYEGITHIDPLKYDLSMDRFMTPDRIRSKKMPDIDQDLPKKHRDLLLDPENGWLKQRFGDHYAQISVDTTLKLKNAVKDVSRAVRDHVPYDIENWTKRFEMPPQGVTDYNFVMGYNNDEGWVTGSIETDKNLQAYIDAYPKDWELVKKCLGLARQKGRHACLPAGEGVMTMGGGLEPTDIIACGGKSVYTGQKQTKRGYSPNGMATLLEQGVREVTAYTLSTGKVIRCTPDHKVLTTTGWATMQEAFDKGLDLVRSNIRSRLKVDDAGAYAKVRGGQLLEWGGTARSSSHWMCASGHQWWAPLTRIYSYEHWCRKCSHRTRFVQQKSILPRRQASKQLSTYRRHDAKYGRKTTVTLEIVEKARIAECVYCNRRATGLERIDNDLGHTVENCAPACLRCNWMRGRYISHDVMLQVGKLLTEIDP